MYLQKVAHPGGSEAVLRFANLYISMCFIFFRSRTAEKGLKTQVKSQEVNQAPHYDIIFL